MRRTRPAAGDRGLSPVVGGALLIAISVLLVSVSAVMVFGLAEDKPPAPTTSLTLEPDEGDEYKLVHQSGETLDGRQVRIVGIADPDTLAVGGFTAGETTTVKPVAETVRIVWEDEAGEVSYTLQTFDVEPTAAAGVVTPATVGFPDGTVFTGSSGDIVQVAGDGGNVSTLLAGVDANAIGSPARNLSGEDEVDVPYLDDNGTIRVVDDDGETATLADGSDIGPGIMSGEKTQIGSGTWRGSDPSVFFVGDQKDKIFRASATGSTQVVEDLSSRSGAQAVSGPADVDGDGDDELVYADSSQTLKFLQPGGTVVTTGLSLGSNASIGDGAVGTLEGYDSEVVTAVDGGNNIVVANASDNDKIIDDDVAGDDAPQAKQSPTAIVDVDDDGADELVYVSNTGSEIKYLDNFGGTLEIKTLEDEDGDAVGGSIFTGVS